MLAARTGERRSAGHPLREEVPMDDGGWRPARLTPGQMEERRLAAAALLRQGRLSQAAIARRLGVSGASVCRWAATLAQDGRRGVPPDGELPADALRLPHPPERPARGR